MATPTPAVDAALPPASDAAPVSAPAGEFPGCPRCVRAFNGKDFEGWTQDPPNSWAAKDGVAASLGKASGHLFTNKQLGNYRVIFSVRQVVKKHQPGVLFFGTGEAGKKPARGLAGIQWQAPHKSTWDYRPENNDDGGQYFTKPGSLSVNNTRWHRCEALVKQIGEFRGACCEIEGKETCKAVELLQFKDPAAGKKGPWAIQLHDSGTFDEYRDIWIEEDPAVDDLVTTK